MVDPPTVEPPAHGWLHPAVEVRSSPIEGLGLFATGPIDVGEVVSRLGGRVVSHAALGRMLEGRTVDPALPYVDSVTFSEGHDLLLAPGSANRFGNHSCDPNTWWTDGVTLVARRSMRPGEEVTNDYGTSSGHASWSMVCRCGSSICREIIAGNDWRRVELRDRYGDHWVPPLLRLIRDGRRSGSARPIGVAPPLPPAGS